ncbi:MAG: hypothetical protein LBL96_09745 [Clostridiales bacterium]|nr:hypothetical protein [Clostridiales bacterium]
MKKDKSGKAKEILGRIAMFPFSPIESTKEIISEVKAYNASIERLPEFKRLDKDQQADAKAFMKYCEYIDFSPPASRPLTHDMVWAHIKVNLKNLRIFHVTRCGDSIPELKGHYLNIAGNTLQCLEYLQKGMYYYDTYMLCEKLKKELSNRSNNESELPMSVINKLNEISNFCYLHKNDPAEVKYYGGTGHGVSGGSGWSGKNPMDWIEIAAIPEEGSEDYDDYDQYRTEYIRPRVLENVSYDWPEVKSYIIDLPPGLESWNELKK